MTTSTERVRAFRARQRQAEAETPVEVAVLEAMIALGQTDATGLKRAIEATILLDSLGVQSSGQYEATRSIAASVWAVQLDSRRQAAADTSSQVVALRSALTIIRGRLADGTYKSADITAALGFVRAIIRELAKTPPDWDALWIAIEKAATSEVVPVRMLVHSDVEEESVWYPFASEAEYNARRDELQRLGHYGPRFHWPSGERVDATRARELRTIDRERQDAEARERFASANVNPYEFIRRSLRDYLAVLPDDDMEEGD